MSRQTFLTWAVAAALAAAGGCNWLAHPLYVFAGPPPTRTINPEYGGLKGKTVAVFVYAGPEIELDYQTAQYELSSRIRSELLKRVKDVQVVDPRRVLKYQDQNPSWDAMPQTRLCREMGADFVLLVSLIEFSTREQGSIHLARGRITAEVSLYPAAAAAGAACEPVWRTDMLRAIYPEKSPLGVPARDAWKVRAEAEGLFAEKLVKKFYKHEVPRES